MEYYQEVTSRLDREFVIAMAIVITFKLTLVTFIFI